MTSQTPIQGWSDLDHQESYNRIVETVLILADVDAQSAMQLAALWTQMTPQQRAMHHTLEDYLRLKGCRIRSDRR